MTLPHEIAEKTYSFTGAAPAGPGLLPVNRFAIVGSKKSMMIDTGAAVQTEETLEALSKVMNPQELDYIFLTHMDAEHSGGVHSLLKIAPNARVIGNMTSMGKGTSLYNIPPEKWAVVFPGQEIDLGDHKLRVEASFIEDGHTSWLFDTTTHTYFTSDAFGAIQFGSVPKFADEAPEQAFAQGFAMWQAMSFNMLPMLDVKRYQAAVNAMRAQDVKQIASVHAPLIRRNLMHAFDLMEAMPTAELPPPPPLPEIFQLR